MVMKNAIPVATGITTSRKIQQGIRQYFEQLQTVHEQKKKESCTENKNGNNVTMNVITSTISTPSSSLLSWYKCETTKGTINDD